MKFKSYFFPIVLLLVILVYSINLSLWSAETFLKTHRGSNIFAVLEPILELRQAGQKVFPNVEFSSFIQQANSVPKNNFFPIGNFPHSTIYVCRELDSLIYTSDEHGFNNPTGAFDKTSEVVILGDSLAEGQCVKKELGMVSLLRKKQPSLVNLARGGAGPLLELATFREYGKRLRPKILLWFYNETNDLEDLHRESQTFLNQYLLDPEYSQNLFRKQLLINDYLYKQIILYFEQAITFNSQHGKFWQDQESLRKILQLGYLTQWIMPELDPKNESIQNQFSDLSALNSHLTTDEKAQLVNRLVEILKQAKSTLQVWQGRIIFIYLPSADQFTKTSSPSLADLNSTHELLLNQLKALDMTILDLSKVLAKQPSPLNHWDLLDSNFYGHLNAQGHALVASEIQNLLDSMK